jgi:hypothetical protein
VISRYGAQRYFARCEAAPSRTATVATIARLVGLDPAPGIEAAVLANASSNARRGLALNLGQNQLIEEDLKRILGLSSVLASRRWGIQDCEEALSGMIKLND